MADATVWFEPKRNYAGAYYDEGFSNAALLQVIFQVFLSFDLLLTVAAYSVG
jgi:hypothetical protein